MNEVDDRLWFRYGQSPADGKYLFCAPLIKGRTYTPAEWRRLRRRAFLMWWRPSAVWSRARRFVGFKIAGVSGSERSDWDD